MLSTLHRIANCIKNGITRKIVFSNRCQSCSVTHNYFWSGLAILFTAFLGTKTQLWKLLWAFSKCCIGNSGSPLQPSLPEVIYLTFLQHILRTSCSGKVALWNSQMESTRYAKFLQKINSINITCTCRLPVFSRGNSYDICSIIWQ